MRYSDYESLRDKALDSQATNEDINALGRWYEEFGRALWNGRGYKVDSHIYLLPIYKYDESGEPTEIEKYVLEERQRKGLHMRKKSMQCLIVADNGYDYVVGGTFRIAGTKYAKLTSNRSEAKYHIQAKAKLQMQAKNLPKAVIILTANLLFLKKTAFRDGNIPYKE